MKFRITDAKTFAIEFDANNQRAFYLACSESLMGININRRRFIEVQFLDSEGVWRLPLKSGTPYRFSPNHDADFNDAYCNMIESANYIDNLSSIGRFVTHNEKKNSIKSDHLVLI